MTFILKLLAPFASKLLPYWKPLVIAIALGSAVFGTWHYTGKYKDGVWRAEIEQLKAEYANARAEELEALNTALMETMIQADEIERKHYEAEKQIKNLSTANRRLAAELGGLRDPGKNSSCGAGTSGDSQNETASGRLSEAASGFLLDFAERADEAAIYAMTCYEWINRNRNPVPPQN